MMSQHFDLSSELTGSIAKRLPHAKNQPSAPCSFFNQFVTDRYRYRYIFTIKTRLMCIYISICNELIEETAIRRKLIFEMWESFGYGST